MRSHINYYDAENKLTQVEKYDSSSTLTSTLTFSYNGFGRRVKKDIDGTITFYIYDNEDIRFETDENGTIIAEYIHGAGIDEPLAMRRDGQNYYYHVNGLGSVTALTDSTKAVVQSYVYDSFGQIVSQTGSITNPYTFTGREYDPEIGLYYYRARYYDPKIGRFISEDPIGLIPFGPQGGINHLYVYVKNNPVNLVDPYGLKEGLRCKICKAMCYFKAFLCAFDCSMRYSGHDDLIEKCYAEVCKPLVEECLNSCKDVCEKECIN
jgi:RHS repeat-associated protein